MEVVSFISTAGDSMAQLPSLSLLAIVVVSRFNLLLLVSLHVSFINIVIVYLSLCRRMESLHLHIH